MTRDALTTHARRLLADASVIRAIVERANQRRLSRQAQERRE